MLFYDTKKIEIKIIARPKIEVFFSGIRALQVGICIQNHSR